MKSIVSKLGPVPFPEFKGERVYMLPFTPAEGLPANLARWQPTIDAMLAGIQVPRVAYLMIDQGEVAPGATHRRPGAHIDGNWNADIGAHGGHAPPPPTHGTRPSHGPRGVRSCDGSGIWRAEDFAPEALILASDVSACAAYVGEIPGDPKTGGDCSHLDLGLASRVILEAGRAYAGNVTMVHESLPIPRKCRRTLVRINVPGWEPVA